MKPLARPATEKPHTLKPRLPDPIEPRGVRLFQAMIMALLFGVMTACGGGGGGGASAPPLSVITALANGGTLSQLAGNASGLGSADLVGSAARFNYPYGVAVDGSGNVYVADSYNHTIRKITSAGVVSTLAGLSGSPGSANGTGAAARFNYPSGVAVDGSGNVYVGDNSNHTIRKITPAGVVSTLAGLAGTIGSTDDIGSVARSNSPYGVAVDASGTVYATDTVTHTLRTINSAGTVSTLAGMVLGIGSADGTGSAASFYYPLGLALDGSGNAYVADSNNHTIRKITSAGVVSTFAGTAGSNGTTDATGAAARFDTPFGVAVDGSGNVYVADTNNHTIRKITYAGVVTTLAGTAGTSGSTNATGTAATFNQPRGVAVDGSGNIYVADTDNHIIRKITSGGVVTTFAGTAGSPGSTDGSGAAARFNYPNGLAVDVNGDVYVADTGNHTVRRITSDGVVSTLVGQAGNGTFTPGDLPATVNAPTSVAVLGGKVYIASRNAVLKVQAK